MFNSPPTRGSFRRLTKIATTMPAFPALFARILFANAAPIRLSQIGITNRQIPFFSAGHDYTCQQGAKGISDS